MKNSHIFQNKKFLARKFLLFYIFQIFLMSGLMGDSWILLSASAFSLWEVILVEVYEENLVLYT